MIESTEASGTSFLYLAVVLDLFTREVAGWFMSESMNTELFVDAIKAAIPRANKNLKVG